MRSAGFGERKTAIDLDVKLATRNALEHVVHRRRQGPG
jgi:hypothetical protein